MPKTALMLMDLQNGIVERIADDQDFAGRVQKVIAHARKIAMPIIYVTIKFRPGYPEVNPKNKLFGALKSGQMQFEEGSQATEVHPDFAPQEGDLHVTKRRVGAFSGSDLDVVLRSQQIDHLVLTGISTSGVVLSTLRTAADLDFDLTVLSDCCADRDPEVHKVLTEKVFTMQARVITGAEWISDQ
jgi:nicotinamidase-related amidase